MTAIILAPELVEEIEQLTGKEQTDATLFVEEAVRSYLSRFRRNKIRTETEAFNRQYDSLLKTYRGQFVAVHDGQIIDHDPDLRVLHLRVHQKLGQVPVLLKQVSDQPDRILQFRSPRLENIERGIEAPEQVIRLRESRE
jgi:hypothetical protein